MGRTARKRQQRKKLELGEIIESEETVMRLKSWLLSKQCLSISYLTTYHFPVTGRGLKTLKDIRENDVLVRLPLEILITTSTLSDSYVKNLFLKNEYYSAQGALAAFLVYESHLGSYSKWNDYIVTLPRLLNNPSFCSKKETRLLPSIILDYMSSTHKLKANFCSLVKSINNLILEEKSSCPHCKVPLEKIITYKKYKWAYYIVNTRAVYIDTIPKQKVSINIKEPNNIALAPFLDFLNHDVQACVHVRTKNDATGNTHYELTTLKPFSAGSQVFINYGAHNNLKLYVDYGFIIPNNPLDDVYFDLSDILIHHRIIESKLAFIELNNFHRNMAFTRQGLNYNATCALFIVSSTLHKDHWNNKLYRDSLNTEDECNVNSLAKPILCSKRKELMKYVEKMQTLGNCSDSFTTATNLIKEYLLILEESEDSLNKKSCIVCTV